MKLLRTLAWSITAIACIAVIGLCIALWVYRDIPTGVLETKYANRASRFINIDSARIHYRDEGTGPAVLLLHANFGNLIGWDPWVDALKDSYRVVRMDFTSHGLTGPDPSGDYSLERTLELTEKFINAMDLDTFSIAGTSMGGTMAIHFTHKYPERVDSLILLNPGSLEGKERTESGRDQVPDAAYLLKYIMPRALPKFVLKSGFGDKKKLTNELVDRWYDLWMREGQREAQLDRLKQYKVGDIKNIIRTLQPRTLLLWGEANTTADFAQAGEFQQLLESVASLQFISYPGVGHMAVQEAGLETGRDVRAFLDQARQSDDETPNSDTLN